MIVISEQPRCSFCHTKRHNEVPNTVTLTGALNTGYWAIFVNARSCIAGVIRYDTRCYFNMR